MRRLETMTLRIYDFLPTSSYRPGAKPEILDCFVTVESQRDADLFASFVRGKMLMQLFVCNPGFPPQEHRNVTELTEITRKAALFAVLLEHRQNSTVNFVVWL